MKAMRKPIIVDVLQMHTPNNATHDELNKIADRHGYYAEPFVLLDKEGSLWQVEFTSKDQGNSLYWVVKDGDWAIFEPDGTPFCISDSDFKLVFNLRYRNGNGEITIS